MTETARIRWAEEPPGYAAAADGFAGLPIWRWRAFIIWNPDPRVDPRPFLTSDLPGHGRKQVHGTTDELKAEAERWLEEFVSSLGAAFPDEPGRPSRAWHADWAEVDRDQGGNAILRHKPTGGMYKVLPVEEC